MLPTVAKLSRVESRRLQACEKIIRSGLKSFLEVGKALVEIAESRLYRATHSSFRDYCRDKWGMSREHAYRFVRASEAVASLPAECGQLVTVESQARELALIKPSRR